MGKIVILDEKTANQIAAGEVIERPASIVKEMVENSIDAGATAIAVEVRNGGISYIRVSDNGCGMESDDVEMAFERHATSKLRRIEDLDKLSTMGFRGEALASIAAVSHLELKTKTESSQAGTLLRIEGGKVMEISQTGCPNGTTFIVRNLFYNTPARYKFLKKDSTEAGYVSDMLERLALSHPQISFKLIVNQQVQHHTPGNNDLLSVIYSVYGKETARGVIPLEYEANGIIVTGFIGKPEIARGNRNNQSVFINGRFIRNKVITSALDDAYKTVLMQHKFPFCVINIKAAPETYDVNVHPQKLEVRFSNDSIIYGSIFHAVKNSLMSTSLLRESPVTVVMEDYAPNNAQNSFKNDMSTMGAELKDVGTVGEKGSVYMPQRQPPVFPGSVRCVDKRNEIPWQPTPPKSDENHKYNISQLDTAVENNLPEVADSTGDISEKRVEAVKEHSGDEKQYVQILGGESYEGAGKLKMAEIVGQAFDTYIILQYGEDMFLIDQHAAHERIRYETLKKRIAEGIHVSQAVLEPYIIKLSALELDFVQKRINDFERIGFELELFGPGTIIIRSIPDVFDGGFDSGDFHQILDRWMDTSGEKSEISDEALFMMSCRGALKANRKLYREEIAALVDKLVEMDNPYTCVHGRPVIIAISKKELEKRFKRIV